MSKISALTTTFIVCISSFVLNPLAFTQAFAQTVTKTTLPQLIKVAIEQNPELQAKKLEWQGVIQQFPQATSLEDPSIVYSEAIAPIETRLGSQERSVALQQKFPYPGKLALQGEVVKKDIEIAKTRYDQASRDVIVALKQSYYEAVYLRNAINLSLTNKSVIEKISHVSITGYANNNSTLNDVAKAQSQYAQVSYDVQLLEELLSTEKTRINTLLNRNPEHVFTLSTSARIPPKLNHPIARLYQFAEANEEMKIADLSIEKSVIKKRLSHYASLPDFSLGVKYAQIDGSEIANLANSGDDALAVSVGLTIPLNRDKNKAIKHQAYLERLKSIEQKKTLTNQLRNKVKGLFFKLNNSHRLILLYQKNLIPQAQQAKHIAEIQFRENKGSITQYLDTQSTWLNFKLAYQRAIADYWKSLAGMEKLTGKKL